MPPCTRHLPILLALLVSGCSAGERIWQRPDTTSGQTRADEADCIRPVTRDPSEGQSGDNRDARAATRARQDQIDRCMEESGYQLDRSRAAQ